MMLPIDVERDTYVGFRDCADFAIRPLITPSLTVLYPRVHLRS